MRRLLSSILCAMMLFTCISCAAAPEIVPEYDASVSEDGIDLKGMTIVIGMSTEHEGQGQNLGYTPGTDFGDLASERVKDIENRFNCDIEFKYVSSIGERAYNSAVGGTFLFDFITSGSFGLLNYMRANAFQNLATVENLDVFDQSKWGNRYMLISTMYDGGIFAVTTAALPLRVATGDLGIICVNETYVSNLLETDPRDYFENGEWNWENFEKCIENFAHTNNSNQYVYSFSAGFGRFARDLALSNGNDAVFVNKNGEFEIGYFTETALEAYNKAWDWFYGATADNVSGEHNKDLFLSGEVVMYCDDTRTLVDGTNSILYHLENFGIVPFPTGPNAESANDYQTSYTNSSLSWAIPITAQDVEISALIMDNLFEPFEGYETEESIIEYLSRNYFYDERDAKLLLEYTTGEHMQYHVHMEMSSMFDGMPESGILKSLESYRDSIYTSAKKSSFPSYATLFEYEEYFHE